MTLTYLRTYLLPVLFIISAILMCSCGGSSSGPSLGPPQSFEFVYVATENGRSISGFTVDSSGKFSEIAGSPFKTSLGPFRFVEDPKSRFLMVGGYEGYATAKISNSHALTFTSNPLLPAGGLLIDPIGRFLFAYYNDEPGQPTHAFSIAPDLSLIVVAGSPFQLGLYPSAIHPTGKFMFGIQGALIDTLEIDSTGALKKIASVGRSGYIPSGLGFVHPLGHFLYVHWMDAWGRTFGIQAYAISPTGSLTPVSGITFPEGKSFDLLTFHPSGKFVFARECNGDGSGCSLDTLSVDSTTGAINFSPGFSASWQWSGEPALDSTGARLFVISGGSSCTVPGLLTMFSVTTDGKLRSTGATAPTSPCPSAVVVTQ